MITLAKSYIDRVAVSRPRGYKTLLMSICLGETETTASFDENDPLFLALRHHPQTAHKVWSKTGGPVSRSAPRKAAPQQPIDEKLVEEVKRRWAICKACEHSENDGDRCRKYTSCCFGKYRGAAGSVCLDTPPQWGPYVVPPPPPKESELLY